MKRASGEVGRDEVMASERDAVCRRSGVGSLRRCRQVAEGGAAEDRKDSCEHAFHVRIGNFAVETGSVLRKIAAQAQAIASASSNCACSGSGGRQRHT